ncbi:MAG: hypothetical protein PHQ65_16315 [Bacteroidales bacterium]|nr:hypothetical protein [Bacteroidales bacterium]
MTLADFLQKNGMSAQDAAQTIATCPFRVFFLTEEFIRRTYPIAALDPRQLEPVLNFAKRIQDDRELRMLAWHLHREFCGRTVWNFQQFPEFIEPLGFDTGLLYLLLCLSLIPFLEERAERENFPLRYAHATATRIGTFPTYFAQAFEGRFGIRSRSLHFMLHYKENCMFRIGRFDFVLAQKDERVPELYRRGEEIVALCGDGWKLDAEGVRTFAPDAVPVRVTRFSADARSVRGTPINFQTGLAEVGEITLNAAEWTRMIGPDDWMLNFHIPAGGGMKPELCRESFREATEFFDAYYADKPFKIIYSSSWIFSPDWLEYLPKSNMAALIRASRLFPVSSNPKAGLYFVFGREDDDFGSYPRTNSLECAMLDCLRDKKRLKATGMFLLPVR